MVAGGYAGLFVFFIGILAFPFGLWNLFFSLESIIPEQSSKCFGQGLVFILFLPVLTLIIYACWRFPNNYKLPLPSSLFYIFGMLIFKHNRVSLWLIQSTFLTIKRAIYQTEID